MTPKPPTTTPLWEQLDSTLNFTFVIHRAEWAAVLDVLAERFEKHHEVYATLRYEADRARNPTHLP